MTTLDVTNRFDAEATWAALHESVRVAIGTAVLNGLAASELLEHSADVDDPRLERVGFAAETRAKREFDDVIGEFSIAGLAGLTPDGNTRIPVLLGMVCEACGCSENDPCVGGCGWARDNLCTACVGGNHGEA